MSNPAPLVGRAWLALAPPALAQDPAPQDPQLPGFYEFFEKAGSLKRIPREVERDRAIDRGDVGAEELDLPLPRLVLPDARGDDVDLIALARNKQLLITPFRTWW